MLAIVSVHAASKASTASGSSLAKASTDMAEYGAPPGVRAVKLLRYSRSASNAISGLMWCAKTALIPFTAAKRGPYPLDPSTNSSGRSSTTGAATSGAYGWPAGKPSPRNASSSATWPGNSAAGSATMPRRSTWAVSGSVPGARPSARSIRPGYMASSVLKVSATLSGAWLGSMIPAAPTRIREVSAPTWAVSSSGALQARLVML